MKFIIDNLIWIAIALTSGLLLIVPILQRRGAKLSLLQATQKINQGKTLVLDVRSEEEFNTGHLTNAKNIALDQLKNRLGELDRYKNQTVITVCAAGVRSASAAATLRKAGFEQVFSLEGGMDAWKAQGLPVVK